MRGLLLESREEVPGEQGGVKDDPGSKMGKGPFTLGHRAVGSWMLRN